MKIHPTYNGKDSTNKYTLEYFFSEVCEFRRLFGSKDFWAKDEEQRAKATFALGYVYMNLEGDDGKALPPEENERAIMVFDATMQEYQRRESMLLFSGLLGRRAAA